MQYFAQGGFSCVFVLGMLRLGAGEPARADWPAFRGADGSAVSPETGLPLTWGPQENIVWTTDLPGAGSSTPIVVGDQVFVTCYSGYNVPGEPQGAQTDLRLHVLALDRRTGQIRWRREVAPRLPEQEQIRDDHGYASSTPAADDRRVYAFFGKSGVHAFTHDGDPVWSAQVGDGLHGWGSGASVVLHAGLVIINASVESEALIALDASTGAEVWRLPGVRESWNTPIIAEHEGRPELVVAMFEQVLGVDPRTGRELWRCATDIPWYMAPSLVAADGVAYAIGGRPGAGLAVRLGGRGDVTRTHRLWTSPKGGNVSSPVLHEGRLYWMHDSLSIAYCADAATGAVLSQHRVDGAEQAYGSPVLAEGRIYYPGRNGRTFVVAAKPQFELLATNSWEERGMYNASPAISGGRLFLRSDRFVCCVGAR